MAKNTTLDKQIISVLKYDVSRPYLGKFKYSDLYNAQRDMRRLEYSDANGSRNQGVYIGKINGELICGALWRLMGYNPRRFVDNPFLYGGKMNIYKFVSDTTLPADAVTAGVISDVRGKLREYLYANAAPNGRWRDEIETINGIVYTVLIKGRVGPMYKKLCMLRDAIQVVTRQNCVDYRAKRKPYRVDIARAVMQRHPEIFAPVQTPKIPVPDVCDLIWDQMDSLQITLDNRDNVSPDLYEQAYNDMQKLKQKLCEIHGDYTL